MSECLLLLLCAQALQSHYHPAVSSLVTRLLDPDQKWLREEELGKYLDLNATQVREAGTLATHQLSLSPPLSLSLSCLSRSYSRVGREPLLLPPSTLWSLKDSGEPVSFSH